MDEFRGRLGLWPAYAGKGALTHLVVYGDREHFANLAYLTGFDPRFEEALLVIGLQGSPLLIVGNECAGYLAISPLYGRAPARRALPVLFAAGPAARDSRLSREILADEGVGRGARVGCVGWKYFAESEHPAGERALDLPSYLADTLRELAGPEPSSMPPRLLMHPDYGLRTFCSPAEIAYFEYTSCWPPTGSSACCSACARD